MGNSVSRTKLSIIKPSPTKSCHDYSTSTASSSHRTLVEDDTTTTAMVPTIRYPNKSKKPKSSILQGHLFFRTGNKSKDVKTKKSSTSRQVQQPPQHASIKSSTLSRNKKPKFKRKVIVTKSIIGRPTNFKHLTSSQQTNTIELVQQEDDEDSSVMAAQMIALAALIKPLPVSAAEPKRALTPPVIPPRSSSHGNHVYLKEFLASPPIIPSSSSLRSRKKRVTKKPSNPSIKKGKRTDIKYASIGKESIPRKHKVPKQKKKKITKTVNSLDL